MHQLLKVHYRVGHFVDIILYVILDASALKIKAQQLQHQQVVLVVRGDGEENNLVRRKNKNLPHRNP